MAEGPTITNAGGVVTGVGSGAASLATAAGAGTGRTLGQGFFGKVTSMAWNGSPVAVKEVSGNSLDAASIGRCLRVVVLFALHWHSFPRVLTDAGLRRMSYFRY